MAWAKPEQTRGVVDRAGDVFGEEMAAYHADIQKVLEARRTINNWRSSHAFPLNTFQVGLREITGKVSPQGFVAQRIKRLPAIQHKLERFPTMRLLRMKDIGGVRAVVTDVSQVRELRQTLKDSRMKHKLHLSMITLRHQKRTDTEVIT